MLSSGSLEIPAPSLFDGCPFITACAADDDDLFIGDSFEPTRLEKRPSGLICPSCVSLSLLQPGNSSYDATLKLKAVFASATLIAALSKTVSSDTMLKQAQAEYANLR